MDAAGKRLLSCVGTKWTARQEPYRIIALLPGGTPFLDIDSYLVGQCDRLDIYANYEGETFAVALKVDGDPNCYLFRGESYQSTNQWRLPQYKIPPGDFEVEVFVEGDNAKSATKRYRLRNTGTTPEGLTLEALS